MLRICRLIVGLSAIAAASSIAATSAAAAPRSSEDASIRPYTIAIPDSSLQQLHAKLELASYPEQDANDADEWQRGTHVPFLRELMRYWREDYDWRKTERRLNELPHFNTRIEDVDIHFIHVRSSRPDAVPFMQVHGWPGSFLECLKMLPLLTAPSNASAPAFHYVCPSLPGYGFSSAAASQHLDNRRIARLLIQLMARLGYDKYVVQGGDWGSPIASHMATFDAEHCRGLHLNNVQVAPPLALFHLKNPFHALWRGANTVLDLVLPYSWRFEANEVLQLRSMERYMTHEAGYFHEQATRPDTLGVALHDSPVGLASWLVEKFRQWSDCGEPKDVLSVFSKDDLLDHISLYHFSNSITSSMRLYHENLYPKDPETPSFFQTLRGWDVRVSTGVALFPQEILASPRKWVAEHFHVVHFNNEAKKGGHFATMEQPDFMARDIQNFVAQHVLPSNWQDKEDKEPQKFNEHSQATEQKTHSNSDSHPEL